MTKKELAKLFSGLVERLEKEQNQRLFWYDGMAKIGDWTFQVYKLTPSFGRPWSLTISGPANLHFYNQYDTKEEAEDYCNLVASELDLL